jgi:hypothetical protein
MAALQPNTIYRVQIVRKDNMITLAGAGGAQLALQSGFQGINTQMASLAGGSGMVRNRSLATVNSMRGGEHLIYEYYFKTSQFSSLSAKIGALNVISATRMYEGVNERVDLSLQGPEKLDVHEVFGFNYTIANTHYNLRFMRIEDEYSSNWHTTYLRPDIYDLYQSIVSLNYSPLRIYRSNPDYLGGIPPKWVYMAMSLSQPISHNEIFPSSGSSGGTLALQSGPSINIFNPSGPISTISISTSEDARRDYNRLRTIVNDMKVRYGNNLNGVNTTVKNKANTLLNTPFKNIYNGSTHNIKFSSVFIGSCSPNSSMNTIKTFSFPSQTFLMVPMHTTGIGFFN